ncbi:gamma-tubulin complex component 3 [Fragilaria crotonensis]|nr:gamma-tubulin complex component 3 [Fragilaria crotonensis]
MSVVDAALKSTNAIDLPPYVLGRLGVKLKLEENEDARYQFGPPKGTERSETRTGWDIFALEYRIPEPLAAIVHTRAMHQYHRLFTLLFGLKRVEYMLNHTWRQSTALHHAIQIYAQHNAIQAATNAEYAQTTALLRHISMSLLGDDDDHDGTSTANNNEDEEDVVAEALGIQLQTLLTLALEFCTYQKQLFHDAIQQAERATEKLKEADRRLKEGHWGFGSERDVKEAKTFFGLTDEGKLRSVITMEKDFHRSTGQFLTYIHQISHGTTASAFGDTITRSPSTNDSVSTFVRRDQFSHDALNSLTFQLDYSSFLQCWSTVMFDFATRWCKNN